MAAVLVTAAASLLMITPAAAQTGDVDCGDPGTSPNMPIDPNNDPNGLDADHDGIGCEDDSAPPAATPAPAEIPAQAPAASDDMSTLPRTGSNSTLVLGLTGGFFACLGIAAIGTRNILRRRTV